MGHITIKLFLVIDYLLLIIYKLQFIVVIKIVIINCAYLHNSLRLTTGINWCLQIVRQVETFT